MALVGPTYSLATRKASVQRSINYMLRALEPGNEPSRFVLEQVPGYATWATLSSEIRGAWWTGSRLFVVAGATLYEVDSAGAATSRGTLLTSTGPVGMAQGLLQLMVVDGANGYILTLASNAFAQITDPDFPGAAVVGFLDGFFIIVPPGGQAFYLSDGVDNATSWDALDFASAESAPDDVLSLIVDHRESWFFGQYTTEPWFPGGADFYLTRNNGGIIEQGIVGPFACAKLDNSVFWVGQDRNGSGMVWRADGYTPKRVSTHAIEELLQTCTDLSAVQVWAYQDDGHTFLGIYGPGMETTPVYDASVGQWHERAELVNGDLAPWRGRVVCYAHGLHLIGGADGVLYRLDRTLNTNAGGTLTRQRISPHSAAPNAERAFYDSLKLVATVGEVGQGISPSIELRYSNDGGYTWGNWMTRSLGAVGQYGTEVRWDRLGSARDRVWHIRCTDNARAEIIGEAITAREGGG